MSLPTMKKKFHMKIDGVGLLLPAFILILWHVLTSTGSIPEYFLPSPGRLTRVTVDFLTGYLQITPYAGDFLSHSLASICRVTGGFLLALSVGLPLGFLSGHIPLFKRVVEPSIHLVRTVPGIGWLPVALVWLGVGGKTTVFLIALAAFFPIYINTVQGVGAVSPLLIRAGRMLGANRWSLITTVIIPASMPYVFAGIRTGLGLSWAYLVLGELTGVSQGLGAVMMDARMLGHLDMLIVCMICIAFWGRLSDLILVYVFRSFPMGRFAPN